MPLSAGTLPAVQLTPPVPPHTSYDQYYGAWDTSVEVDVLGEKVRFFHEKKAGVDRLFVDHPLFLAKVWGKTGSKLYGAASGADYRDNTKRFALFCHASLAALGSSLPFAPGDGAETVVVANDWHTSLIPVLLKTVAHPAGKLLKTRSALCIHNIAFQGRFLPESLKDLGVPPEAFPAFAFSDGVPILFTEDSPAAEDGSMPATAPGAKFAKVNWLKAGLAHADKTLTVSPNYAKEVVSGPAKGVELHAELAAAKIEGICNGMDTEEWNPKADKFLDVPYDADTVVAGKAAAKQTLQAEAGLALDPTAPLFGYIGRLEEQKGVDILMAAIPGLLAKVPNAQVVILGTGKKSFEAAAKKLAASSGGRAVGVVQFSEPLAHLITAGADFLAVPSRFEPCGLIQLHAMRYGTVPIVASTGGLVDTVAEGVTGWHIGPLDPDDLVQTDVDATVAACVRAANAYTAGAKHAAMSAACISQDLGWKQPAIKWEATLAQVLAASTPAAGARVAERMADAFAEAKKASVKTPVENIATSVQKVVSNGISAATSSAAAAAAASASIPAPPAVGPKSVAFSGPGKPLVSAAVAAGVGAKVPGAAPSQPVTTKPATAAAAPVSKPAGAAAPAAAAPAAAAPAAVAKPAAPRPAMPAPAAAPVTLPGQAASFEARRAELKVGEDAAASAAKAAKLASGTATAEKPQPGPPAPKPASNN